MVRKTKSKIGKRVFKQKQKQKQSVNVKINIDNSKRTVKKRRPSTGRTVRGGGGGGGASSSNQPIFYTNPINLDNDTFRTINEGLTSGFASLSKIIHNKAPEQPVASTPPFQSVLEGTETLPSFYQTADANINPPIDTETIFYIPKKKKPKDGYVFNPRTGIEIQIGGRLYKKLVKEGVEFNL